MNTLFSNPQPDTRPSSGLRRLALGIGFAVFYAVCVVVILHFVPEPRKPADYMIAGTLATLFTLVGLFATLIAARK